MNETNAQLTAVFCTEVVRDPTLILDPKALHDRIFGDRGENYDGFGVPLTEAAKKWSAKTGQKKTVLDLAAMLVADESRSVSDMIFELTGEQPSPVKRFNEVDPAIEPRKKSNKKKSTTKEMPAPLDRGSSEVVPEGVQFVVGNTAVLEPAEVLDPPETAVDQSLAAFIKTGSPEPEAGFDPLEEAAEEPDEYVNGEIVGFLVLTRAEAETWRNLLADSSDPAIPAEDPVEGTSYLFEDGHEAFFMLCNGKTNRYITAELVGPSLNVHAPVAYCITDKFLFCASNNTARYVVEISE